MKNRLKLISSFGALGLSLAVWGGFSSVVLAQNPTPVPVIFDTDMSTDCDDTGALAVLNKLADNNEATILACVADGHDADKAIAASISAINTYYGRSSIPIGTYQGTYFSPTQSVYTAALRDGFPQSAKPDDQEPTALGVYRQALASAANGSVTIISAGFLINLEDLLNSPADQYSSLDGVDLVRQKVKNLVVMGGYFQPGALGAPGEHNFTNGGPGEGTTDNAVPHTQFVLANWPTPILFSGYEIGVGIGTGSGLASTPTTNPVRKAYQLYTNLNNRSSWDLTAVLAAVWNPANYWNLSGTGSCNLANDGTDSWVSGTGDDTYLIANSTNVAPVLEGLLDAAPGSVSSPPTIVSSNTATGTVGSAFSYQISATISPTSYGASNLPAGLGINTTTGLITGTPTASGTFTVTLSATNKNGTGTAYLTLVVNSSHGTLPSPWTSQDIGSVGVGGGASYSNGVFSVTGSGADIWGSADAFQYVSQTVSGSNATIIARLTQAALGSISQGNDSKTGIMFRDTSAAGSEDVYLIYDHALGLQLMYRNSTGGGAGQQGPVSSAIPVWLELVKTGNSFSGYYSTNGTTWTQIGSAQTVAFTSSNYFAGLVCCSNVNTQTATATLDNVSVNGGAVSTPVINSSTTASGTVGSAFSYQITASNSPASFGATNLPSGLALNTTSGVISGTPAAAGTSNITLTATNASGSGTATLVLTVSNSSGGSLPSPWTSQGIGSVGVAGSASYSGGVFTVTGSGADIWGTADAFQYVNQSVSGTNETLIARITQKALSSSNQGNDSKTGIMFRDTTAAGSEDVYLVYDYSLGLQFMYRNSTGGGASQQGPVSSSIPVWLELVKTGNSFSGYFSTNGTSWTQIGSAQTVSFTSGNYLAGLVCCSNVNTQTATATLDNVSVSGNGTAAPVINSNTTASGIVGSAFSYQITATNSPTSYNASNLPSGLGINTTTGVISGTPTASGTANLTITATNASGSGSATLVLTVSNASGGSLPSPWASQDVGSVGVAGSASYSGSTFTITGSGADIWGTADAFQYVNQTVNGTNETIIARITQKALSSSNQGNDSKTGIMFRNTTAAGSEDVYLVYDYSLGLQFMYRNSTGGGASQQGPVSSSIPIWLELVKTGNSFSGYYSTNGTSWTQIGSAQTVSFTGGNYLAGLICCSNVNTQTATATLDNVSVTGGGTSLPSPWTNQDIGSVGVAGSASYSGGVFTVTGSGADIWGTADAFQYVNQTVTRTTHTLIARVTQKALSSSNQGNDSKTGIMFRDTSAAGSEDAYLVYDYSLGLQFMFRTSTGGGASQGPIISSSIPVWLKLVKSTSSFSAYYSTDGVNWTQIGSAETASFTSSNYLAGLVCCSNVNTQTATATLDNITLQ